MSLFSAIAEGASSAVTSALPAPSAPVLDSRFASVQTASADAKNELLEAAMAKSQNQLALLGIITKEQNLAIQAVASPNNPAIELQRQTLANQLSTMQVSAANELLQSLSNAAAQTLSTGRITMPTLPQLPNIPIQEELMRLVAQRMTSSHPDDVANTARLFQLAVARLNQPDGGQWLESLRIGQQYDPTGVAKVTYPIAAAAAMARRAGIVR